MDVKQIFEELESQYFELFEMLEKKFLSEEVDLSKFEKGGPLEELSGKLDQLSFMFDSARKALKIVGTMKPGEFRAKHTRQLIINLNKIRGRLQSLMGELGDKIV